MRLTNRLAIVAAATFGFAALPAQAAVQVTAYQYSPPALGGGIALDSAGYADYGTAGRFLATIQDLTTLNSYLQYTFCLDVLRGFYTYSPYADVAMSSIITNPGQQNALAGLLTYANGVIDGAGSPAASGLAAAAFGLAIWEVVYEASGPYNLTTGDFHIYGDFAAAGALANSYLGNIQNGSWTGNIADVRVLAATVGENQNQIYIRPAAPVPEPSTWALLLAGFGMVGAAMRRRVGPVLRFVQA